MKYLRCPLLLVLLASATAGTAAAPGAPDAPRLAVTTLGGNEWALADSRGRWVIVNFWATWCGPCIKEMPAIDAFVKSRGDVRAIGLAWQDATPAEIAAFLRQHPVAYPVAIVDPFRPVGTLPPPRALPTTYLIDPHGRIARTFLGPVTRETLRDAVKRAGAINESSGDPAVPHRTLTLTVHRY